MTRRPLFWAALVALAVGGAAFAARYYSEAFPLLSVDIQMTRRQALADADALARAAGWEPFEFRQAASFGQSDPTVQTFVELEGGGAAAFAALVEEGPYRPYVWEVRHFAEGEAAETRVRFTPEGTPYGFRQTLPEDAPGPALAPIEARAIAEAEARGWGVDLTLYVALEASLEVRPVGRADHTFIYERRDPDLGAGAVRLRLVVAGDRPTELTHFVHVPEAFERRYQEIRSANDTLALIATVIFTVGFMIVGCGVGFFYLLRHHSIVWRTPVAWAIAIAALMGLGTLNQLPQAWMGYDTAVSSTAFLLQNFGLVVGIVVFGSLMLAFVFIAAEGLSRWAFPSQPQQWRVWSRGAANSDAVLGRTVGAYLWLPVDLGFVVGFYLLASRLPGWWIPSDAMVDPDLLSTPFPWLMALSLSMFAATWEESLFRAIPLAGAKLLGNRFGASRVWIVGALLLQALVFAAAHANYPQQPAYARMAELFVPALLWGLFYLRFGLLPVILIHFLHNFTFFSVFLFAADDPGLLVDRVISVSLMLAPLAVVLVARVRWGRVREMSGDLRNGGWRPEADAGRGADGAWGAAARGGDAAVASEETSAPEAPVRRPPPVPGLGARRILAAAGVAGAVGVVWALAVTREPDAPPLSVGRGAAVDAAGVAIEAMGAEPASWDALSGVIGAPDASARFVMDTSGEDAYRALLGGHIAPPSWRVRFVRFSGPVEDRADQWSVLIGPAGEVLRVRHSLPEGRTGDALAEADARALAVAAAVERLGATGALREISAEARARPARGDWLFTFAVLDAPALAQGEARIQIEVAGSEVVDARRFVQVPEAWERSERARQTRALTLSLGSLGALALLLLGAVVTAVVAWSRGGYAVGALVAVAVPFGLLRVSSALNGFPAAQVDFSTAQPISGQWFSFGVGVLLVGLVAAAGVGLLAGLAHTWLWRAPSGPLVRPLAAGVAAGLAVAAARGLASRVGGGDVGPDWPAYAPAGVFLPVAEAAITPVGAFLAAATMALLMVAATDRMTRGWSEHRSAATQALLVLGIVVYGVGFELSGALGQGLARWIAGGLVTGGALWLTYHFARWFHPASIPVMVAVALAAGVAPDVLHPPFVGAAPGAALAIALTLAAGVVWSRALERSAGRP